MTRYRTLAPAGIASMGGWMRPWMLVGMLAWMLTSCNETDPGLEQNRELNLWMVNALKSEAVENAVISQRTLYAYHFVDGSDQLNELGRSDLEILAGHYRKAPGALNIRRSGLGDEIYAARVEFVRSFLEDRGVELERMAFADGLPGGSGAPADRVARSLKRDDAAKPLTAGSSKESAPSGENNGSSTGGTGGMGGTR
jgi:hypothetical protein